MSDWWWYALIIVAVLAAAYIVFTRLRSSDTSGTVDNSTRDYQGERETDRLGGMSAEDREWEAASLERNRQTQEAREKPPTSTN